MAETFVKLTMSAPTGLLDFMANPAHTVAVYAEAGSNDRCNMTTVNGFTYAMIGSVEDVVAALEGQPPVPGKSNTDAVLPDDPKANAQAEGDQFEFSKAD
jgi:hypothetical protein